MGAYNAALGAALTAAEEATEDAAAEAAQHAAEFGQLYAEKREYMLRTSAAEAREPAWVACARAPLCFGAALGPCSCPAAGCLASRAEAAQQPTPWVMIGLI